MAGQLGTKFAEALAAKDFTALAKLFSPQVDFRGMTPGRFWESSNSAEVIDGILRQWFEDSDHIDELVCVETGEVADRERVAYRFVVTNPDGRYVVEQQAYYETRDGAISWMRVMCSGFRELAVEQAVPA